MQGGGGGGGKGGGGGGILCNKQSISVITHEIDCRGFSSDVLFFFFLPATFHHLKQKWVAKQDGKINKQIRVTWVINIKQTYRHVKATANPFCGERCGSNSYRGPGVVVVVVVGAYMAPWKTKCEINALLVEYVKHGEILVHSASGNLLKVIYSTLKYPSEWWASRFLMHYNRHCFYYRRGYVGITSWPLQLLELGRLKYSSHFSWLLW